VSKNWVKLGPDGRDFLIEQVPFVAISNAVQKLPLHASAAPDKTAVEHLAALEPLLPREVASTGAPERMQLAQSMPDQAGVVLDYTEFDWAEITTNFDFQCNQTYYINGDLYFDVTPTFEEGTVIKSAGCLYNLGDTTMSFNDSGYYQPLPVVFTSPNDDSIGEIIASSSGTCYPGEGPMYLEEDGGEGGAGQVTVAHVRFAYAGTAYEDANDTSHVFQDCEFLYCGYRTVYVPSDGELQLQNDLFVGCGSALGVYNLNMLFAYNITVDSNGSFLDSFSWGSNCGGSIMNSIVTPYDDSIDLFGLDHTWTNGVA